MKKVFLVASLLTLIFSASAQTVTLNSSTPTSVSSGTSVHVGVNSGNSTSASSAPADNCFVGRNSGRVNAPSSSSGNVNSFFGNNSGYNNTSGNNNLFSGFMSGFSNTTGAGNVYLGMQAGYSNLNGGSNVFVGMQAGFSNTGLNNTFLGYGSGNSITSGVGNVCIGSGTGGTNVNNQLFVDNSTTSTPLIWGDFASNQLKMNGKVGVGGVSTFPSNALYSNYSLFVTGGMLADEVRVALSSSGTWADYVFAKDYKLKTLSEVESFIKENGHLPNVPSAAQVKEEGINVAQMATIQQEKIEELTLYIIEQNKRIEALEAKMNSSK